MKRIAIVGAGISGLSCAWRLEELRKKTVTNFEIALYDSAPRAGGAIRTEIRDEYRLEHGPDSFISEKPWTLDLCKKLGIESEILDTQADNRRVSVLRHNRLVPLPEGFYLVAPTQWRSFVTSGLFSIPGKLRMASEVWIPKKSADADESVASFIRRRFGQEALERIGQPMIAGIYSGDPERLSAASAMPQFRELERAYGSVIRGLMRKAKENKALRQANGPRYGLFLSFRQGMETLIQAAVSRLPKEIFRLNRPVTIGRAEAGKWLVEESNGHRQVFEALCLTVNARQASRLLKEADADLAAKLGSIAFESVLTINLAYKKEQVSKPLDGFGFVVPAAEQKPFMSCTFASQKYKNRAPSDGALFRLFVGGAFGKKYFEMDDADLKKTALTELKRLLGIRGEPCFDAVERHANALPQYEVGHQQWMSDMEESLRKREGLFLTGASYRGTGITHCIKDAQLQADNLYRSLLFPA